MSHGAILRRTGRADIRAAPVDRTRTSEPPGAQASASTRSRLAATRDVELAVDAAEVGLDRLARDEQRLGDLGVAVPLRRQLGDAALGRGELLHARAVRVARPAAGGAQLGARPLGERARAAAARRARARPAARRAPRRGGSRAAAPRRDRSARARARSRAGEPSRIPAASRRRVDRRPRRPPRAPARAAPSPIPLAAPPAPGPLQVLGGQRGAPPRRRPSAASASAASERQRDASGFAPPQRSSWRRTRPGRPAPRASGPARGGGGCAPRSRKLLAIAGRDLVAEAALAQRPLGGRDLVPARSGPRSAGPARSGVPSRMSWLVSSSSAVRASASASATSPRRNDTQPRWTITNASAGIEARARASASIRPRHASAASSASVGEQPDDEQS